ncbi:ARHGEF12 [Lepeophtheirus salmonis]|uniref:ARHGEF12 n=1 Tax=Lepeophtheirus salmonis TaxID=72036 RepID=A0A7R8H8Y8_LEPSM|nr:ARHGEF12 [Lepeophtheirus salmonis]CAF2946504.1 ARHGEF12 [Lepeophtheirus salmonis]
MLEEEERVKDRRFVVHKDTNGYGLTLFGYRPVFVQTVKAKGAADRAGIKERDIILQVNGINVTESSHDEVVDIIKGPPVFTKLLDNKGYKYVALTISRMKNESHSQLSSCSTSSTTLPHYVPSSILSHSNTSIVTAPQPPNSEAVRILTDEKYHTIQLMAEQERRNVDGLRQNLVTLQPESDESLKKQEELELALRRLIKLEEQLEQMREKVQTPNRTVPRPSSSSDIPPPLPARNKNMTSPSLSSSSSVPPPPTLPPRQVRTLPPLPPPIKPSTSFNFSRIESQVHSLSYTYYIVVLIYGTR